VLSYLEEVHEVVVEPLSHVELMALATVGTAYDGLVELLERAADFSGFDAQGEVGHADDCTAFWQLFERSSNWATTLAGKAELHRSDDDYWVEDRIGQPAVGAGFTLPLAAYDELRHSSRRSWLDDLRRDRVSVGADDYWTRCYRTMYFAELITKGSTLDAQARAVAEWFDESIATIAAADPGLVTLPPPRRRRKVAELGEETLEEPAADDDDDIA
jgi:hypothetical protein